MRPASSAPTAASGRAAAGYAALRQPRGGDKHWSQMGGAEQAAVMALGWTAASWDAGDEGPLQGAWEELGPISGANPKHEGCIEEIGGSRGHGHWADRCPGDACRHISAPMGREAFAAHEMTLTLTLTLRRSSGGLVQVCVCGGGG